MLAAGHDPYPVAVPRTHTLREVRAAHPDLPPDTATGDRVGVTGRVIFQRNTGKLCFATLREGDGTELQAMLSLASVGAEELARWKAEVDLGDHVFVDGRGDHQQARGAVRHGRPLGDGRQGDATAAGRAPRAERGDAGPAALRRPDRPAAGPRHGAHPRPGRADPALGVLHDRGFVEVETPMLQLQHGGATARPFVTHANALDTDLYLRIAPELFLKRMRRRRHRAGLRDQPQLPQRGHRLHALAGVRDARGLSGLRRPMTTWPSSLAIWCIASATAPCSVPTLVRHADGSEHDLGGQWRQVTLHDAVSEAVDREVTVDTSLEDLRKLAAEFDVEIERVVERRADRAGTVREARGAHPHRADVRPRLPGGDPPADPRAPRRSAAGRVVGPRSSSAPSWRPAYSELVDPVEQRERLHAQSLLAAAGDAEAMQLDEDFLRAMEYGMPPTGGMGMGIDRLLWRLPGSESGRPSCIRSCVPSSDCSTQRAGCRSTPLLPD